MGKQLVFSFDFDNTISWDPKLFLTLMELLENQGHTVYVCTCRMPTTFPEDLDFLVGKGYKVFFTSHKAKKPYMESLGISVDVWVDDCAESILEDWDGPARTYKDMESGYNV